MDLSDYLRIVKRRWWILLLIPLMAGGAVAGLQVTQPPTFQATATVAAPALVGGSSSNQYSGAAGPKAFVSNFEAAVTSPIVVNEVSQETGVAKGKIKSGLVAAQVGTSSIMEVTYTAAGKQNAGPVANAAARDTITFLFKTQLDLAQKPLTVAKDALSKADGDLDAFTKQINDPVPDRTYTVLQDQISQLQQARATAVATGVTLAVSHYDDAIAADKQQLIALGPIVSQSLKLQDTRTQAVTNLSQVQQAYQQADAQFEAANPDKVVSIDDTVKVAAIAAAIQGGIAAAGGGLFLAIGIVAIIELSARRRRPAAKTVESKHAEVPVEGELATRT